MNSLAQELDEIYSQNIQAIIDSYLHKYSQILMEAAKKKLPCVTLPWPEELRGDTDDYEIIDYLTDKGFHVNMEYNSCNEPQIQFHFMCTWQKPKK